MVYSILSIHTVYTTIQYVIYIYRPTISLSLCIYIYMVFIFIYTYIYTLGFICLYIHTVYIYIYQLPIRSGFVFPESSYQVVHEDLDEDPRPSDDVQRSGGSGDHAPRRRFRGEAAAVNREKL